jgi:type IV pilus assembly protein PilV
MSCGLIVDSPLSVAPIGGVKTQPQRAVGVESGMGMLECLLALLIFSTGMMGVMSAQWVAKKAVHEASQRSTATVLGADIVERMRANRGQLEAYRAIALGDTAQLLPRPDANCNIATCTALQLARFDLWQWESNLLGLSERGGSGSSGGLVSPLACISSDGGEVSVTISWLVSTVAQQPTPLTCSAEDIGAGATPSESNGDTLHRRQLIISTFIGEV